MVPTNEKVEERRTELLVDHAAWVDQVLAKCESPIEQLLALAFLRDGFRETDVNGKDWHRVVWPYIHFPKPGEDYVALVDRYMGAAVVLQAGVTVRAATGTSCDYRLDAAVFLAGTRIAVEVDGHDFHERTKEQAQRDKERDRNLTAAGWHPIRFTGSEVYRDPDRAASDVHRMLTQLTPSDAVQFPQALAELKT